MNGNIFSLIRKEYEQKQRSVHDKLKSKKQELSLRLPELADIENKIQESGLAYSKLILAGAVLMSRLHLCLLIWRS